MTIWGRLFTFKCQKKINFPSPRSKLRGGKEIRWKRPKNFWKNALESFQWKLSKFPLGSFFWIAAKQRLFICMRKKKDETDYWANKKEARRKTNKKSGKIEWKLNVEWKASIHLFAWVRPEHDHHHRHHRHHHRHHHHHNHHHRHHQIENCQHTLKILALGRLWPNFGSFGSSLWCNGHDKYSRRCKYATQTTKLQNRKTKSALCS